MTPLQVPPVTAAYAAVHLDPVASVRRVGFVLLSTDLTSERDAASVLGPEHIAVHVSRLFFENPTTPENLRRMAPRLTEAADLLVPGAALSAICYSCTSGTIEIGAVAVATAVNAARPGVPVVTPPEAAIAAFAALGARRVALLTPYLVETTQPMAAYLVARDVELVAARCLGLADDREMARISHDSIIAAAVEADHPDAEALFISCTALPALGVIDEIERRIGKPVISSNQACLWQLRRHAGSASPLAGFGRLFMLAQAATPATVP